MKLNNITINKFYAYIKAQKNRFDIWQYRRNIPQKVKAIRCKEKIKVAFMLFELGSWKTESLYKSMLEHGRFDPIIIVTPSLENYYATSILIEYLKRSNYSYIYAGDVYDLSELNIDIMFYQKPYKSCYMMQHWCEHNKEILYCFIEYGLHTICDAQWANPKLNGYLWQNYFENEDTALEFKKIMRYPDSITITGYLPFDRLFGKIKCNPWKNHGTKKRIIYAPHHSFKENHSHGLQYATFLEYGEYILELAKKYKNKVQWAFKPHPRLYDKLVSIWGQERTDKYYQEWGNNEYGQVELGVYEDLFMTSDAMIHDCSTFTIEYHSTQKPVLYLFDGCEPQCMENLTSCTKQALDLHYKAYNKEQIEEFILNVISNKDPMLMSRKVFCESNLRPPYNKTAAQNILNSILGEQDYKI